MVERSWNIRAVKTHPETMTQPHSSGRVCLKIIVFLIRPELIHACNETIFDHQESRTRLLCPTITETVIEKETRFRNKSYRYSKGEKYVC